MLPTELVKLSALIERSNGSPEVKIGLVDGPVFTQHADLAGSRLFEIPGQNHATCVATSSAACLHGTFIAGILSARKSSAVPSVCPSCTVLIRPIFAETTLGIEHMPSSTPEELAAAVVDCVNAGANVVNLSLALARPSTRGEAALETAFNFAAKRNVIVVAAAGNQGTIGSSAITRHQWVIPVVGCDLSGSPMRDSNLGRSIGRLGLSAPGHQIVSLKATGGYVTLSGTSIAAPFVTGAVALLMSAFPRAPAALIKLAISGAGNPRRAALVPPLLNAEAAYQFLASRVSMRRAA